MGHRRSASRELSRRDFLKVGGAGLAGAALLRAAGCGGGGEQSGGATELYFTAPADASGTTSKLISQFNEMNQGKYKVVFREGSSDTGERLNKLRTQLQAGGENLDIILGDVIWTAELKQMTRKVLGESDVKFGFLFQGARYEGRVCDACEFIWSHDGNVLDPNDPTEVVIDSPQAIAGLETERSMITDGISPDAVAVYEEPESEGGFLNGDAVFLRNWPYVYALIGTSDYPKLEPEQVGVSELPSADGEPGNGTVGDQPLYISTSSKYPDAAWKFIEFVTASEQQRLRALEGSYLPTRSALYDDPEIRDTVPVVALAQEALQHTRPRPVSPFYSDMSLEMAEQFNASLKGDITPEEAARTLKSELERIIQQGQEG